MTASPDNPFPGLRPFEAEWCHLFFGREAQIDAVLGALHHARFLGVVGSSGSGKSSLIRAGLIPALRRGYLSPAGSEWRILIHRPGLDPLGSLARALVEASGRAADDAVTELDAVRSRLGESSFSLVEELRSLPGDAASNRLIVVDQFEELFRALSDSDPRAWDDAAAFVQLLLTAAHQQAVPVYVVITMRSDYIGDCTRFRGLPEALNENQYLVPRMTREQVQDAIEGPVAVQGASIAPSLVQHLLNAIGDAPDDLPLLQHVLMRLWDVSSDDRAAGRPIDLHHYTSEHIRGFQSALDVHANAVLGELTPAEIAIARRVFQRLSEKGPGNREVRRLATLSQLADVADSRAPPEARAAAVRRIVEHFACPGRSFLVRSARGDVDISHESLLRQWGRLNQWVTEESRSRDLYLGLSQATLRFYTTGSGWRRWQRRGSLMRGPELAEALAWWRAERPSPTWAQRYQPTSSDEPGWRVFDRVARFLRLSAWRRLSLRTLATAAIAALIVTVGWFVRQQRQQATRALVSQLATQADQARTWDLHETDLSLLLRAEAFARAPGDRTLREGLQLALSEPIVQVAAFDADGLSALAFDPGGTILAYANHGSVHIVRVPQGESLTPVTRAAAISAMAFSPDGRALAAGGWDGVVEVISTTDGRSLRRIEPRGLIGALAYGARGRLLAVATDGGRQAYGEVRVYATDTWQHVATIRHAGAVRALAFSPTDALLLSGSDDHTARLVDGFTGRQHSVIRHADRVVSVAFAPSGALFATASANRNAHVAATAGGTVIVTLAHSRPLTRVAFSADGHYVVSSSVDGVMQVVDLNQRASRSPILPESIPLSFALSPDGARAATAGDDGSELIEVGTGRVLAHINHSVPSSFVEFTPDGRWLAVGGSGTLRLFNVVPLHDVATLDDAALLALVCTSVTRPLTADEVSASLGQDRPTACANR